MAKGAFAGKALGYEDKTGDFRIRKMLVGWACEAGKKQDTREPISPGIFKGLWGVWSSVCSSSFEGSLFHAASLLAFFGALRVSELVLTSKNDLLGRALSFQDLQFVGDAFVVNVWHSKTAGGKRCQVDVGPLF